MKKCLFALMITLIFSSSAIAAGYGQAGCGLGSLIFKDTAGPVQILAATTNGTSGTQTFGISSGTSNCDTKGFDLSRLDQERFVANNFSGLAKEMATGDGEQLIALAGLMGCPPVQQPRFNAIAQQNYQAIFVSDTTTPTEMLSAVRGVMSRDAELAAACTN
jgi:hypothetical protein